MLVLQNVHVTSYVRLSPAAESLCWFSWFINGEKWMVRGEANVVYFRYYLGIRLGWRRKLRKASVVIYGFPAEIRTTLLPVTSQTCYRWTHLLVIVIISVMMNSCMELWALFTGLMSRALQPLFMRRCLSWHQYIYYAFIARSSTLGYHMKLYSVAADVTRRLEMYMWQRNELPTLVSKVTEYLIWKLSITSHCHIL
jgi:hypothetical protein